MLMRCARTTGIAQRSLARRIRRVADLAAPREPCFSSVPTNQRQPGRASLDVSREHPAQSPNALIARRTHRRGMTGVTLIELVVTLSIAAILLTIGVPSFQNIIATNRIASLTNELSTALQLARSEAVTRGKTVTVCKSDDVSDSTPTCNTGAAWQNGWLVFVDDNNNGALDIGDLPLRVGQPASGNAVITTTGTKFENFVKLQSDGRALGASNLSSESFVICIAPNKRSIILNRVGRLRITTETVVTCP